MAKLFTSVPNTSAREQKKWRNCSRVFQTLPHENRKNGETVHECSKHFRTRIERMKLEKNIIRKKATEKKMKK